MTYAHRAKLDREAVEWFNSLVYGFACYHTHTDRSGRDRWYGHPRSHEEERNLSYARLLRLIGAFEMSYKFSPNSDVDVPAPRWVKGR